MKKNIYIKITLTYLIALVLSISLCKAQNGRIPIESEVSVKKSTDPLLAKEDKKDMSINIDKSMLSNPKYIIFWVEDSSGEVVKSEVLDEDKLLNKLAKIQDKLEIRKKDFALKFQGLSPGEYKIHVRIIINEDLIYVVDKTEIVS